MGRKIDSICELFLIIVIGLAAIVGMYWVELSILSSDMRFLILKLIGFLLPFAFLATLSTRADLWSFRKQAVMAAIFSLIILTVTAMTVMTIVNDSPPREHLFLAMIVYAVLWIIDNGMFISYVRNLKQTSAKYSCRNRIIYCLEKNPQRHARLAAGIFVQDEQEFLFATHLNDADPDLAIAALEGPAFASWIAKKYNNDHDAALKAILKNTAAGNPEKPPDESDKTEP